MARQRAMKPPAQVVSKFRSAVWRFFRTHRRDFPWRNTNDPYRIVVSEVMLQQTQAPRVVEKYLEFCARFPSFQALARARFSTVLKLWKGLGYNRRARALVDLARAVVTEHRGRLPDNETALQELPGIGPYTAAAVRAFAFNRPGVVIETNIRAVFIHHFFPENHQVSDAELAPIIALTCSKTRSREWYTALMDYGAHLKATHRGIGRRSRVYTTQSRFKGSFREFRARVLNEIASQKAPTVNALRKQISEARYPIERALDSLTRDGLITRRGSTFVLTR